MLINEVFEKEQSVTSGVLRLKEFPMLTKYSLNALLIFLGFSKMLSFTIICFGNWLDCFCDEEFHL